jgi:hypothetical protein
LLLPEMAPETVGALYRIDTLTPIVYRRTRRFA